MAQKLIRSAITLVSLAVLPVSGWATTSNPTLIVTPPQPRWVALSAQQKTVLAPLAADWDAMESYRRKKWLGIAQRFPTMSGEEQLRVQAQMQEWAKLTPEQRRQAREKYQSMSQLPTEKQQELKQELKQKWEEYSNLPEEEKQKHQPPPAGGTVPKPGRPAPAGAALPVLPSLGSGGGTLVTPPATAPATEPPVSPAAATAADTDAVPRP
ncbi:MAG: DUF3106 domain-containing protein [Betaproteobacteria bacterium]|nr:DUF3106 domain-containing protein [Betaproteobacteria bacterium]